MTIFPNSRLPPLSPLRQGWSRRTALALVLWNGVSLTIVFSKMCCIFAHPRHIGAMHYFDKCWQQLYQQMFICSTIGCQLLHKKCIALRQKPARYSILYIGNTCFSILKLKPLFTHRFLFLCVCVCLKARHEGFSH